MIDVPDLEKQLKKLNEHINFTSPVVSAQWLSQHISHQNIIVLDASIKKVTNNLDIADNFKIPNARFFDLKGKFSDVSAPFPNTVPSEEQFTNEAQKLGINANSFIVVYDDKGIYSSARAWWLFKAFGHKRVAVLDGGLHKWKSLDLSLEKKNDLKVKRGNFQGKYNKKLFKFFDDIQINSKEKDKLILDARSNERFLGKAKEPREGLRSGTIFNSKNLPYTSLLNNGELKSTSEIKTIFSDANPSNKEMIFSCGSGITACILALGAELVNNKNVSVYDGSWTEYGTLVK